MYMMKRDMRKSGHEYAFYKTDGKKNRTLSQDCRLLCGLPCIGRDCEYYFGIPERCQYDNRERIMYRQEPGGDTIWRSVRRS